MVHYSEVRKTIGYTNKEVEVVKNKLTINCLVDKQVFSGLF